MQAIWLTLLPAVWAAADGEAAAPEPAPEASEAASALFLEVWEACDAEDAMACHDLGMLYLQGYGAPHDRLRGMDWMRASCHMGYGPACFEYAVPAWSPRTSRPNVMERGYYVDRACELGDQRACNDPFMATVYACTRREHGVSCLELARAWQEGEVGGGPPDLLEAALLYSRACELGQGGGCRHLGLMFRDGEALNASASRAQEYFALGCELGDGAACALLAGP